MDDIHGLKPFMYFAPSQQLILALFLAIGLLGVLIYWWSRKRPTHQTAVKAPPAPIPLMSVKEQLDRIRRSRLIETGRYRDFHTALSGLVRGYLGTCFGLPGRRMTTTELLLALTNTTMDERAYRLVADLLPPCDLVKFSKIRPSPAEMEARLAAAYQLVEWLGDSHTPVEETDDRHGGPEAEAEAAPAPVAISDARR